MTYKMAYCKVCERNHFLTKLKNGCWRCNDTGICWKNPKYNHYSNSRTNKERENVAGLQAQGKQETRYSKIKVSPHSTLENNTAFLPKASRPNSYADYSSGLTRPQIKKRRIEILKRRRFE